MKVNSVTIVTPVFNRPVCVIRSIKSSLELVKQGSVNEIIVVDDGSFDQTAERIASEFSDDMEKGWVRLFRLESNHGVTYAKNFGVSKAESNYVLFLDSDDVLLPNIGIDLYTTIENNPNAGLIFFRCLDLSNGELIGPICKLCKPSFRTFLNTGTPGECIPLVDVAVAKAYPYRSELRGCESLTYFDMLYSGVVCVISDVPIRGYCLNGSDRLSTSKNIRDRAVHLLAYNKLLLKYWPYMTLRTRVIVILRLAWYSIITGINYAKARQHRN